MRTKEVEIEKDGEIVKVTIRALKQRETELLEKQFGMGYDFKNKCAVGNVQGYSKKALPLSIVEPEDLKNEEALGELDRPDYLILQKTFAEVNNPMKEDEKGFLSVQ